MEEGLIDAQLGEHIYKKRIASNNQGKRSSFRTILAFKINNKALFIFGFSKNKLGNINKDQLSQLKILASLFVNYSDRELQKALDENELIELDYHE